MVIGCDSGNKKKASTQNKSSASDWKRGVKKLEAEPWMVELSKMVNLEKEALPRDLPAPSHSQNVKIIMNKSSKGKVYYTLEWFCPSYSDFVKGYIPLLTMRGWRVEREKKVETKKTIFQLKKRNKGITAVISKMPSGYFWKVRLSTFNAT